jgi:hypothetical protein
MLTCEKESIRQKESFASYKNSEEITAWKEQVGIFQATMQKEYSQESIGWYVIPGFAFWM